MEGGYKDLYQHSHKRMKVTELDARSDGNPGLSQGNTLGYTQTMMRLMTKFDITILSEAFGKRASRKTIKDLMIKRMS